MAISSGRQELSSATPDRVLSVLKNFPGFPDLAQLLSNTSGDGCGGYYVAGGAVRNIFLNCPINDVDIFIHQANLSQLLARGEFPYGRIVRGPLGSPRWMVNSTAYFDLVPIEAVRHGFPPSSNIYDVLDRFDITGNAIALDVSNGQLIDPQNGIADLRRRIVRAVRFDFSMENVGPKINLPWRATVFLRILHYAAVLNLTIDPHTLWWLRDNSDCLIYRDIFAKMFFEPRLTRVEDLLADSA